MFNAELTTAFKALQAILDTDIQSQPTEDEQSTPEQQFRQAIGTHVEYSMLYGVLLELFEVTVDPPTSDILRNTLENVMGRLVELRYLILSAPFSIQGRKDDFLRDKSLTIDDVKLRLPTRLSYDRIRATKRRSHKTLRGTQSLTAIAETANRRDGGKRCKIPDSKSAIHVEFSSPIESGPTMFRPKKLTPDLAALIIQKYWRGHLARKFVAQKRLEELMFLGVGLMSNKGDKKEAVDHWKETHSCALLENKMKFLQDITQAKVEIPEKEVKSIESGMETLLRSFVGGFRNESNNDPAFPLPVDLHFAKTDNSKQRRSSAASKGSRRSSKIIVINDQSVFKQNLSKNVSQFSEITEIMKKPIVEEPSDSTTEVVEVAMVERLALEELKETLRSRVERRIQKEIAKAANSNVVKKILRKKSPVTEESMQKFLEKYLTTFSSNKILIAYQPIDDTQMLSDKSVVCSQHYSGTDDVHSLTVELLIFPMVSINLHKSTPLLRSVLITGPHGSGKASLVNMIASTIGANLIHITSLTFKRSTEQNKRLTENLSKFCKYDSPTIFWFDSVDYCFARTKLKGAPVRKAFRSISKAILPGDRTLLIATASRSELIIPSYFDLILTIHNPSHRTRLVYIQRLISKILTENHIVTPPTLDLLGHITNETENFSFESLKELIGQVFTDRYIMHLSKGTTMKVEDFHQVILKFQRTLKTI